MKTKRKKSSFKFKVAIVAIKIVLCMVLLITTTFAMFTDDGTPDVIMRVRAGTIEMDLLEANDVGNYVSIKNGKGDLFGAQPWEPNQTRIVFLMVRNDSDIRVKYTLQIEALLGGMAGSLEYCSFEGQYFSTVGMDWEDYSKMGTVRTMTEGQNPISGEEYILMEPGDAQYFTLAIHMLPESDNQYQDKACIVDVNVHAIQANANV